MARNLNLSNAAANAEADALAVLANGGTLCVYDGTQPADADTAVTAQNLLAELTLSNPAFGSASGGVITANAIGADADADATGAASWFRVKSSGGAGLWDGSVGISGCDLNLNSISIQQHANVAISSFTHTVTK